MDILYGNYIGKDIEVLILKKYTLVYIFDKSKNTIESCLLHTEGFVCKAASISDANAEIDEKSSGRVEFFRDIEGNSFFSTDDIKTLNGIPFMSVHKENDLFVFTLLDGRVFSGTIQERYENGELIPSGMEATSENVGDCLREWHLGLTENWLRDTITGVVFNSPKHMCIFNIYDNEIYCRAARYATCSKGVVFNQNFRQFFHDNKGHSFACQDNMVSLDDLHVAEEMFDPNECVLSNYNFYWSVSKVESDCITLNGCGGETYRWLRPVRRDLYSGN